VCAQAVCPLLGQLIAHYFVAAVLLFLADAHCSLATMIAGTLWLSPARPFIERWPWQGDPRLAVEAAATSSPRSCSHVPSTAVNVQCFGRRCWFVVER
jgi:hypothetical protein